jgi:hypothetical protein
VKWVDEAEYPGLDEDTRRLLNDRANRSLSLERVDASGNITWTEKNLMRVVDDKQYWTGPKGGWLEVGPLTYKGRKGKLFRRGPVDEKASCLKEGEKNPCNAEPGKICLIETFLPDDLPERIANRNNPLMCYRWTIFACDGSYPLRLKGETNNDFDRICVGAIVEAIRD